MNKIYSGMVIGFIVVVIVASLGLCYLLMIVGTSEQLLNQRVFQFATLGSFLIAFVQFTGQNISNLKSKNEPKEAT